MAFSESSAPGEGNKGSDSDASSSLGLSRVIEGVPDHDIPESPAEHENHLMSELDNSFQSHLYSVLETAAYNAANAEPESVVAREKFREVCKDIFNAIFIQVSGNGDLPSGGNAYYRYGYGSKKWRHEIDALWCAMSPGQTASNNVYPYHKLRDDIKSMKLTISGVLEKRANELLETSKYKENDRIKRFRDACAIVMCFVYKITGQDCHRKAFVFDASKSYKALLEDPDSEDEVSDSEDDDTSGGCKFTDDCDDWFARLRSNFAEAKRAAARQRMRRRLEELYA